MEHEFIDGGDMMLFLDTAKSAVAYAKSHKLTITTETSEVSTKDNGGVWKFEKVKKLGWSASTDGLIAKESNHLSYDDLFDLMVKRTPIDAVFCAKKEAGKQDVNDVDAEKWTPEAKTPTKGIKTGKCIITSLELVANNGEEATYSVQFSGCGELKNEKGV